MIKYSYLLNSQKVNAKFYWSLVMPLKGRIRKYLKSFFVITIVIFDYQNTLNTRIKIYPNSDMKIVQTIFIKLFLRSFRHTFDLTLSYIREKNEYVLFCLKAVGTVRKFPVQLRISYSCLSFQLSLAVLHLKWRLKKRNKR